jgi:NADH-quinone oxidoreductase subunit N
LVIIAGLSFSKRFGSEQYQQTLNWLIISILASLCFVYFGFARFYKEYYDSGSMLFGEMLYLDIQSIYFKFLISLAAIIVLLHISIVGYRIPSEFYPIFVGMILGLFFLTMTTNLLMLYISIEMVSICSYILVAFNKAKINVEAGIKYLLYGATSSAIMLYGISFLYGMTGTLNFASHQFATNLFLNPTWVVYTTCFMTLGGLFFKISAAPFHAWTPDVYEATPTPVVAFFSIAPKAAALLALIRFLTSLSVDYQVVITVIVVLSLTIGNFSALWQTNTKRMLAYSTIAHAGFMLVGVLAANDLGIRSSIFYISTYMFLTLAAFLLIDLLALKTESYEMQKLKGLGHHNRLLGIAAVVIMMGLVGLPPTVGFTAKFLVFSGLWEGYAATGSKLQLFVLIFGLLNTAVSMFYYLKIPYYMIIKEGEIGAKFLKINYLQRLFLLIMVFFIIYLFAKPAWLMGVIQGL